MTDLQEKFDPVHVVHDYWDGPRSGAADYRGVPHWFESIFDKASDDYSDEYWLIPLSLDALAIAKRQNEIFLRWREALNQGKTDASEHPALPHEREEYTRLKALFDTHLDAGREQKFRLYGEIKAIGTEQDSAGFRALEVKWTASKPPATGVTEQL